MQALLAIVEEDRRKQVDAILGEARARAAAQLRDAHREARERMRSAFADERRQRAERVHAAQANLQTRRRLTTQQRATALLGLAGQRLPEALARALARAANAPRVGGARRRAGEGRAAGAPMANRPRARLAGRRA